MHSLCNLTSSLAAGDPGGAFFARGAPRRSGGIPLASGRTLARDTVTGRGAPAASVRPAGTAPARPRARQKFPHKTKKPRRVCAARAKPSGFTLCGARPARDEARIRPGRNRLFFLGGIRRRRPRRFRAAEPSPGALSCPQRPQTPARPARHSRASRGRCARYTPAPRRRAPPAQARRSPAAPR